MPINKLLYLAEIRTFPIESCLVIHVRRSKFEVVLQPSSEAILSFIECLGMRFPCDVWVRGSVPFLDSKQSLILDLVLNFFTQHRLELLSSQEIH